MKTSSSVQVEVGVPFKNMGLIIGELVPSIGTSWHVSKGKIQSAHLHNLISLGFPPEEAMDP